MTQLLLRGRDGSPSLTPPIGNRYVAKTMKVVLRAVAEIVKVSDMHRVVIAIETGIGVEQNRTNFDTQSRGGDGGSGVLLEPS
jgi:hypothetical protein